MFPMKNKTLQIIVTVLLSALALYLAFRGVDFQTVGNALKQVHTGWIIITIGLIFLTLFIRAQRWRILLKRQVSLGDAFGLINIGYLISGVLPLRAGDPARAVAASWRGPVSALAALSVVVVERVLDMFIIILILLATLPFVQGLRTYLATGQLNAMLSFDMLLILSGSLAFGILAAFILIAFLPQKVEALARRVLEKLQVPHPERWLKPLQNILEGLAVLRSPRQGLSIIGWSCLLWIVTPAYFAAAMRACGAFLPKGQLMLKSTVATWASAFGMVFPATGGLGSFHFAVREALFWGFAIPRDLGFTYAVIIHALPYLTGIILGAITLITWGISFKNLVSNAQRVDDAPTN